MPALNLFVNLDDRCVEEICGIFKKVLTDLGDNTSAVSIAKSSKNSSKVLLKSKNIREKRSQLKSTDKKTKTKAESDVSDGINLVENENEIISSDVEDSNNMDIIDGGMENEKIPINMIQAQEQFISQLSDEMSSYKLGYLHRKIFEALLNHLEPIYAKTKSLHKVIALVIPKFINSSIRELDFGKYKMFSTALLSQAIFDCLHKANGLERLIIPRSCFWRKDIFSNLNEIFPHLSLLKVLHIHYICTPDMISNLSNSCPNLVELNLNGSSKITDAEIPELASCKSLKKLVITGTGITGMACRLLIKELDNLKHFEHCAFNCRSDTVIFESRSELFNYIKHQLSQRNLNNGTPDNNAAIATNEIVMNEANNTANNNQIPQVPNSLHQPNIIQTPTLMPNRVMYNLEFFWLFNPDSNQLLITLLCPDLKHLRLDFITQDMETNPDLEIVEQLSNLEELTLNIYDECRLDLIVPLLEVKGSSLSRLNLHLADNWARVAPVHNIIPVQCPNLQYLSMKGDYDGKDTHLGNDQLDFTIPSHSLSKLEILEITGFVNDKRLLHILLQAPNLRIINLDGQLENLSDWVIIDALNLHPLPYLEDFWINVSTSLTLNVIDHLLKSENKLQRVGRLCHFAQSSREEYTQLLQYVRSHNFATTLVWVSN